MKKLFLYVGTLMLLAIPALANPCVPGTLQDYISFGSSGCWMGAASFGQFVVLSGQSFATPIDPTAMSVTPIGGAYAPGLQFGVNTSAGAGELFESFFRFTVIGALSGASLLLGPGTTTVDGAAIAIEDICADGTFGGNEPLGCSGIADTAITARTESFEYVFDQKAVAGSFFDVFVDITIDGGLAGSASLESVTTQFGMAVPEPSAGILLASGIALLGFLRRRL
jgi:hypothetical protein